MNIYYYHCLVFGENGYPGTTFLDSVTAPNREEADDSMRGRTTRCWRNEDSGGEEEIGEYHFVDKCDADSENDTRKIEKITYPKWLCDFYDNRQVIRNQTKQ